jgi:hypothetical protein
MTPQQTYPFPASKLATIPNFISRAAALAAGITNTQIGPYNPSLPIKGWILPVGTGTFNYLDPANQANGFESSMPISDELAPFYNLPGAYTYPKYSVQPCMVTVEGLLGFTGGDVSSEVCTQAQAQALASLLQPLYKQTLTPIEADMGYWPWQYEAGEQRREWVIPGVGNCQNLITAMNSGGVGSGGSWSLENGSLLWTVSPQVIRAPSAVVTMPAPIRALETGESLQLFPNGWPANPLFGKPTWMVVDAQAVLAVLEANYEAAKAALIAGGGTPN